MDCYKNIFIAFVGVLAIMVFFDAVSRFEPLEGSPAFQPENTFAEQYDSRYKSPYLPPVNPIVYKTQRVKMSDNLEVLKVPLQMNDPFDEQLRSQIISVTKYNKIKYC
jgi:hypothetical protein